MHTNRKLFLHSPKQPSQRRCSIPQQTRACIDRSWCCRQPARVKQKAVSSKLAFLPPPIVSPIKRKHLKASLVRRRSIPSTTPRRCWIPHRNVAANHASRNNGPSPAPPAINLPQTQPPMITKSSTNIASNQHCPQWQHRAPPYLSSFTGAHLALYAPGRCHNADCDQGACWDFPSLEPVYA